MKNVVFITVDSLRADYVFGPKAPDSLETLPSLIEEGISYTNAFSNAAYTKGSFLSIMSGTYPWMFDTSQDGFGPDRPHVAQQLSDAGWATGGFHTNTYLSPTYNYDKGFDHYLGRDSSTQETSTDAETRYTQLIERAVATKLVSDVVHQIYTSAGKHLGVQLGSNLYKPAAELNDAIVNWTAERSEPMFVWAHYMDVHTPYYPHDGTVSDGFSRRKAVKLFHRVNEKRGDAKQEDLDALETLYRGEIEYFDRQLGDLLDRLDRTIDLDETLIVFTSDHGEAFNEKGYVFHPGYALYDENTHIPLILRGPGLGHGEVETPVSNADLVPTILSNLGLQLPDSVVGEDISTYLTEAPENRVVFSEAWTPADGHLMVTDGEYKLIRHMETGEEEMYDRRDPFEEVPIRADAHVDSRDELAARLDSHIDTVEETSGRSGDVEVTEDVRLQLKKLGYDE